MTPREFHAHVRKLADSRCLIKHPETYDYLNSSLFDIPGGPPCDECINETYREIELKRGKAHGRELSPEEANGLRKEQE